jgi:hypothetical protein
MVTAMNIPATLQKLDLPPIDQIGFVVKDIDQAMQAYAPLFGPWTEMASDLEAADFRGKPENCSIKMAFGHTGELEIELIEVLSGKSPHTEFLDRGLTGMHHIRYRITDIESKITEVETLGYKVIWWKRMSDEFAFCYMEKPGDPLLVELLEMP